MSIYGRLLTDTQVERALLATITAWLPSYLVEVNRQEGELPSPLVMPQSYEVVRNSLQRWNEQKLPAIVVHVGGTVNTSRKGPRYRVVYNAQVAAIVAGQARDATRTLAGVYSTAIAALATQHGDLNEFAEGVEWKDTDYDLIAEERSRTLIAAIISLDVAVNDAIDVSMGPVGPPPDPDDPGIPGVPDYGNADDIEIDITLAPIGDTPL